MEILLIQPVAWKYHGMGPGVLLDQLSRVGSEL